MVFLILAPGSYYLPLKMNAEVQLFMTIIKPVKVANAVISKELV